MLVDMTSPLEPPSAPFATRSASYRSLSPKTDTPLMSADKHNSASLSINYLPSKFSNTLITKRKKNGKDVDYMLPKQGGGREAFRSNEARMPGDGDDDYDGVTSGWFGKEGGRTRPKLRWNRFKWTLFVANFIVSLRHSINRLRAHSYLHRRRCLIQFARFKCAQQSDFVRVVLDTCSSAVIRSQVSLPVFSFGSTCGITLISSVLETTPNSLCRPSRRPSPSSPRSSVGPVSSSTIAPSWPYTASSFGSALLYW